MANIYKALVSSGPKKHTTITSEPGQTKSAFIKELRNNGFKVDPNCVQLEMTFNFVMRKYGGDFYYWRLASW